MRDLSLIFLLLFVLAWQVGLGTRASDKIVFGFNPSNSPPILYQFENQTNPIVTGGLIFEVASAIADDLQVDYALIGIPRARIPKVLHDGKIDLNCHNSMSWGQSFSDDITWSKPLYTYANVLVSKTEIPYSELDQVPSGKIGTVDKFYYNGLETFFRGGTLQRVDAPTTSISLRKLLSDRVDYVVMSDVEYTYYAATYPFLQKSSFTIGKTDIRCSLSQKSSLEIAKLNRTIDRLQKRKVFKRIYDRYLNPKLTPEPFSYGLNNDESPPFLFYEKGPSTSVKGGVFFEIGLEIAKKIKRPVQFVLLPRGRLDSRLAEGRIEVVCYNTEVWAGDYAKMYDWSIPIFRQSNYIVGLKLAKSERLAETMDDLKGKTIGTTLNFIYPAMTPYFQDGRIIREDAGSGFANVEKLNGLRVSYIILNNLEYNHYKKIYPNLQKTPFELDPVDVKCAVSKKSNLKIDELNEVLGELKRSGKLQRIFYPP